MRQDDAEGRRLQALHAYQILDTPPESDFDAIAVLAARTAGAPMAIISFLDESRQWFKAAHGLAMRESQRADAFCDYTIRERRTFIVTDAASDPQFARNPMVTGAPHIRFYAGVPLLLGGEALGSLAVMDHVPRELSGECLESLQTIALQVAAQLELRRQRAADATALLDLTTRLHQTLESLTDGFFTLDGAGRFTFVNRAAERMLRRSREELLGEKVWHLFDDVVDTVFFTECQRAVKDDVTVSFEAFYAPLEQWFQTTAYPTDEGLAVYVKDVTERRVMEDALRDSEARFRAITRVATDTVWDWALGERIEWLTDGMRIFGYDESDTGNSARWWRHQIHPDDYRRVVASIVETLQSDLDIWRCEYRFRRKDGSWAYLVDQGVVIRNERGEPVRMVGGSRDQTERYAYQEQLAEQAALLDQARDAILVRELDHRIRYWNEGAERLYGWRAEEVLGHRIDQLLYRDTSQFEAAVHAVVNIGEWCGEIHQYHRDGSRLTAEGHWTLVRDEAGRPKSILAINTDVTHRIEIEEQLRWSQRLEAVGQLTGGVAHDFNNLLTVIMGNAELLIGGLDESSRLRTFAEMTRTAAEQGADLTKRLLAFARRQRLEPKATNVNRLLARMEALLRRTLDETVEIAMQPAADVWNAMVDPAQLEAAVLNLCLNSRDAMPNGGRLSIETRNAVHERTAELGEHIAPGQYVQLVVADTGFGIPPDTLERIFEPFFTTKGVGEGSGLGLSMVYGFAKQTGGDVQVRSEVARGTSVTISLPRADTPDDTETRVKAPVAETGGTERILLVEDDPLVRAHVAEQLLRLGYRATPVADGNEALEALRQGARFDLLFTDMVMPGGVDGRQLADTARRLDPDLCVLFTSGYTDDTATRREEGAILLNKPYSRQVLARKVREALAGSAGKGR